MVRALLSVVFMALLLVRAVPASAQEQGLGGSFITPFPDNDVYQVQVVGDWLAEGLMGGLVQAFTAGPGVSISRKRYDLDGLMRNSSANDMAQLEQTFGTDPSHIAIVMLGAQDRYGVNRRRTTEAENDEWRGEYGARVDRLMKLLKKNNRAVYWVGLPNMRRWQDNERAQRMNDVIRERAYMNGVRFIDAYASFIDESGGYSDWGPDVTGKVRRLRDTDGVHFTEAGYLKLAHFVERELKRDIVQARTERSIPLAGDTAEQSRVNPEKVRLKAESDRAQAQAKSAKGGGDVAVPSAGGGDGARDQKLETGKVDIKVPGAEGTEQIVTIEIVRPAIPASVVALVTRKTSDDKAAQMGDVLVDQIPGGLTVMSSIVPPRGSDGSRRRMSPTQSPYFRVLEKGERLPSKPGRADDFTWPRQQTTAAEVSSEPPPMADGRRGSTASTH
ncbi:MAG: GDSL-type esterase/lipase family protein [Hyphomicrobium sp.]